MRKNEMNIAYLLLETALVKCDNTLRALSLTAVSFVLSVSSPLISFCQLSW